jgi:hypothetical protein
MLIEKFGGENIEDKIKELERKIGIRFPEEYRIFLIKYNGGELVQTSFNLNGISSSFTLFYGLEIPESYGELASKDALGYYENRFKKQEVFSIGETGLGDEIAIGMRWYNIMDS